ncbi:Hypothetical predicted protein [Mytilus galloprovincialis]|uniref:Uncharacterized protein n=1 Tax=Mytilus galloprovincialis TaxID=29158 RepID=A0A8B6FB30_MYTGA|nr:Hypothetical predicted protein [Mytilus galloprovincialis]
MNTKPIDVLIEFIGIMNHYTTLVEAEYLPFLTEIWKFCKVLQTENTRKTKGDIGYSIVKIAGGSFIIAGMALTPVSFGTSQSLTIAGLSLTSGSTVASISHSIASKIKVKKRKPEETEDQLRKSGLSEKCQTKETLDKSRKAGFLHTLLSKVDQFAKSEQMDSRFYIIERILDMWSLKSKELLENVGHIYIKKYEFEIEEVTVDTSLKTSIKNKAKSCLNNVKMTTETILKTVPAVKNILNVHGAGPVMKNGTSKAYSACDAYSNVQECFSRAHASSLASIHRVAEAKKIVSMQPAMQKLVPASMKKTAHGITTLHPAIGYTLTGAGIFAEGVTIGLNIRKIKNHDKCDAEKSLGEVITLYESERKEFHKTMYEIAEQIEKQLIPEIQNNKNSETAMNYENQIHEFNRLRTYLTVGFKSVFDIFNGRYECLPI